MEHKSIWEWLAIKPTTDTDQIKKAYASQAKLYHPEEKPEEFQQLRKAYKQAMKLTKSTHNVVTVELANTRKSDDTIDGKELYNLYHLNMNRNEKQDNYYTVHVEMNQQVLNKEPEDQDEQQDQDKQQDQDEFADQEKLDFKPFYEKMEQERTESQFQKFINEINKLAGDPKLRNNVECWKTLFASVDSVVIHNQENFTKIIKALIWRNGVDCEIYEFIYQIFITIDGDEKFEQLKKNFKFQYDRAIEQKNNSIKNNIERKELLKQTLQKLRELSMNGVGKDNLYLWKDILEDERVDVLYTAEDFVEIILFVLSLDHIKSEILNYIYHRSEKVYDTSPSLAKAKYKLFNRVNEEHNREYQRNFHKTMEADRNKVDKTIARQDKDHKFIHMMPRIAVVCMICTTFFLNRGWKSVGNNNNSRVKDIPTIDMEELNRKQEELSKKYDKYKDQLDQLNSSSESADQNKDHNDSEEKTTKDSEMSGESVLDEEK